MDVEGTNCPVCFDPMTIADLNFRPCPCGFQICGFCYHRIEISDTSQCPSCRAKYRKENIQFTPPDAKEIKRRLKASKKANRKKHQQHQQEQQQAKQQQQQQQQQQHQQEQLRKSQNESQVQDRSHLKGMRVVQRNLVYVTNLSIKIAQESLLEQPAYFGQYGEVQRIAVTVKQLKRGEKCAAAYVTFEDESGHSAYHCIRAVDGAMCEGRALRAAFGTTKYCSNFLRNVPCKKPGCTFLHRMGAPEDTLSPKEMATGKHYAIFQAMSKTAPAAVEVPMPPSMKRVLPVPGTYTKDDQKGGNSKNSGKKGKKKEQQQQEQQKQTKESKKSKKKKAAAAANAQPTSLKLSAADIVAGRSKAAPAAAPQKKKKRQQQQQHMQPQKAISPPVQKPAHHQQVIGPPSAHQNQPQPQQQAPPQANLIIGPPPSTPMSGFMTYQTLMPSYGAPAPGFSSIPKSEAAPRPQPQHQPQPQQVRGLPAGIHVLSVLTMPPVRSGWSFG